MLELRYGNECYNKKPRGGGRHSYGDSEEGRRERVSLEDNRESKSDGGRQ